MNPAAQPSVEGCRACDITDNRNQGPPVRHLRAAFDALIGTVIALSLLEITAIMLRAILQALRLIR